MTETISSGSGCSAPHAESASFEIDQCHICFNDFDTDRHIPKLLECSHTFCLECLEKLHSVKDQEGRVDCPSCRHRILLPEDGDDTQSLADNSEAVMLPIIEHQHEDTSGRPVSSLSPAMIQDDVNAQVYRCAFVTCSVCTILTLLSMGVLFVFGFILLHGGGYAVLYSYIFLFWGSFCALVALFQSCILYLLRQRASLWGILGVEVLIVFLFGFLLVSIF